MSRILNYKAEIYSDSFYFAIVAKNSLDQFEVWRYLRVSIIMAYSAIEAALNEYWIIKSHNNSSLLVKYFGEDKNKAFRERKIEVKDMWRMYLAEEQKPFSERDKYWVDFLLLRDYRNKITHFKGDYKVLYQEIEKNINKCLLAVRDMFISIYGSNTISEWERSIPNGVKFR